MLSLVLPTYNEAQNLAPLIEMLEVTLRDIPHEILIVDDNSPDGTWRVAQMLAERLPTLRVLRRIGRRGLSSAVVDGFDAATGDILAVMDADGQHDAALLVTMVTRMEHDADIVIGSRYMPGGSVGAWVRDRRIISSIGTFLSNRLSVAPVTDPLSGFFAVRRTAYLAARQRLRPSGFKILLELLAHLPRGLRVIEIPLMFRPRMHGESKLTLSVHVAFALQIVRLALRQFFRAFVGGLAPVFWLAVLVTILVLLPRVWALRFLLLDADVRERTSVALRSVADRQGWLLSDVTLLSVTSSSATLLHQPHGRFLPRDRRHCLLVFDPLLLTCDDR